MTFPFLNYDDATLELIDMRRAQFTRACPRHSDPPAALTFSKEILAGVRGDGPPHVVLYAMYECGCTLTVWLEDAHAEPVFT